MTVQASRLARYNVPSNEVGRRVVFDVRDAEVSSISLYAASGTFSTAIFTVYQSSDGITETALFAPSGSQLATGTRMLDAIDVSGINYLVVKCTTAEGSTHYVHIYCDKKSGVS
jgi:hypothetical protein